MTFHTCLTLQLVLKLKIINVKLGSVSDAKRFAPGTFKLVMMFIAHA